MRVGACLRSDCDVNALSIGVRCGLIGVERYFTNDFISKRKTENNNNSNNDKIILTYIAIQTYVCMHVRVRVRVCMHVNTLLESIAIAP